MAEASGSFDGRQPRGFYQRLSVAKDRLADRDFLVAHHRLELAAALVGGPEAALVALGLLPRELPLALGLLALVGLDCLDAPFLFGCGARELLVVLDATRLGGGIRRSARRGRWRLRCRWRILRGRRFLRRGLRPGGRQRQRKREQRSAHEFLFCSHVFPLAREALNLTHPRRESNC